MLYAWGAWLIFFFAREKIPQYIEDPTLKGTAMNLSPAVAQAALDYAEELAATGLSSEQYDHYYL